MVTLFCSLSPESSFSECCNSWRFCLAAGKQTCFICLSQPIERGEMNVIHNQLCRDDSMISNLTDMPLYITTTEKHQKESITRNNMWKDPLVQLCKRCGKFFTLGRFWIKNAYLSKRDATVLREKNSEILPF